MTRVYAIKLDIEGEIYRLSTDSLDLEESGEVKSYQPIVISVSPPTSEIVLDSSPPIQTSSIEVWDADSYFSDILSKVSYESVYVEIKMVEGDTATTIMNGYMTDVTHDGVLRFTVRDSGDRIPRELEETFGVDSFQYTQYIRPVETAVSMVLRKESTPWAISTDSDDSYIRSTPLINKNSGRLISYSTLPSGRLGNIQVELTDSSLTHFSITSNGLEAVPTPASFFPTAGYVLIGSPREVQVVFRYTRRTIQGSGTIFSLGNLVDSFPNVIPDDIVIKLLDSSPEVRLLTPTTLGNVSGARVVEDEMLIKHNGLDLTQGGTKAFVGHVSLGRTYKEFIDEEHGYEGARSVKRDVHEVYKVIAPPGVDQVRAIRNGFMRVSLCSQHGIPPGGGAIGDHFWAYNPHDLQIFPSVGGTMSYDLSHTLPRRALVTPEAEVSIFHEDWYLKKLVYPIANQNVYEEMGEFGPPSSYLGTDMEVASLRDRMKGRRVDMLRRSEDLVRETILKSEFGMSDEDAVDTVMNRGSERFAVVERSYVKWMETVENDFRAPTLCEVLLFSDPSDGDSLITMLRTDYGEGNPSETEDIVKDELMEENALRYVNVMKAPPGLLSLSDEDFNLGFSVGRDESYEYSTVHQYFLGGRYRVIHDPVPQNPDDLGRPFPIAYGLLERVPLLYAIGQWTGVSKGATAGDDVYIMASNRVSVSKADEVDLYLGEDIDGDIIESASRYMIDMIESPFPKFAPGEHYSLAEYQTYHPELGDVENTTYSVIYDIPNPYHKLISLETSRGLRVSGIKLRGGEWHHEFGNKDRRFPVRNGIGNTSLLASFAGQRDEDGSIIGTGKVLTHPVDIIRHLVKTYGDIYGDPLEADELVDIERASVVKSKTPFYEAGVYITEKQGLREIVNDIAEQFGIKVFFREGKIKLAIIDIDDVSQTKWISQGVNLSNKVEEISEGYADIYNRLVYRYKKDWVTDSWGGIISLDDRNSRFCREASKSKGEVQGLEIDAAYVNSDAVARDVVSRLEKILCTKRVVYKFSLRYMDEFVIEPADVVPMTYYRFGMNREPVLVRSVQYLDTHMEVEVIRFPNLTRKEKEGSFYKPSRADICD